MLFVKKSSSSSSSDSRTGSPHQEALADAMHEMMKGHPHKDQIPHLDMSISLMHGIKGEKYASKYTS